MKVDTFQEIVDFKYDCFHRDENMEKVVRAQLMQLSLAVGALHSSLLFCSLTDQPAEASECQALYLKGLAHLELSRLTFKQAAISLD